MKAIKSMVVTDLVTGETQNEVVVEVAPGVFASVSSDQWNALNTPTDDNVELQQSARERLAVFF